MCTHHPQTLYETDQRGRRQFSKFPIAYLHYGYITNDRKLLMKIIAKSVN